MMLSSSKLPLYEISGDIVGTGSDGEPLLANAAIVRKMRRLGPLDDCWNALPIQELGATEKIWKHVITGQIWCALSGCEFRCEAGKFTDTLRNQYRHAPARAERIITQAEIA